ncbi:MAG TPA: transposase [Pricia antarctica]|uniref:Transposase n=1 Tax=Pricia antarctica TaxID=641691 RepID=A0A831QP98_9FLAO|nr:transposase [Pricia antarctica]
MHLSAIVYNLKKYLKFEQKPVKSGAEILALAALVKRIFQLLFGAYIKYRKLAYNF